VLAHELGHFSRHHVWKRMGMASAVSLALFRGPRLADGAGLVLRGPGGTLAERGHSPGLFFMIAPSFTFLLQPLGSLYSRLHEFEADAYAAQYADARDLVRALVKLYEDNAATLTPDPLHSAFYDSTRRRRCAFRAFSPCTPRR